jgi:UDPglucose 6-dehydrogenase
MNIGIVGVGVIGEACKYGFEKLGHKVYVHDIRLGTVLDDVVREDMDIVYFCLPTPSNEDGSCNTSIVEEVLTDVVAKYHHLQLYPRVILAVKSTVEPGFTQKMIEKLKYERIAFVPEFLRERCAISDFTEHMDLLAVGTDSDEIYSAIIANHGKYPKAVVKLTTTEAELLKYYSNVFNAMRIIFANEMYEISNALGANYSKVKDAFMMRKTATDIYMDVNENFRGYGGMCFRAGTKIYTKNGLENIEDIEVGTEVLTHTGQYMPVLETFKRDIDEEILKIKVQGLNESVFVTKEHPILSCHNNRKLYITNGRLKLSSVRKEEINLEWFNAETLCKGDYVVLPVPKKNGHDIINNHQARLLGYYLAEGSTEKRYYTNKEGLSSLRSCRTSFAFHVDEPEFHNDVAYLIRECFDLPSFKNIKNRTCTVRASGSKICEFLENYGGKYADEKKMPWSLLINSSKSVLENILIGYLRGDGSRSCNVYTCATISKDLFEQIKFILLKLAIPFATYTGKAHTGKDGVCHKEAYYIKVSSNVYMEKISTLLQDNYQKIEQKSKTPAKIFDDKIAFPIKKIESIYFNGPVYNLEVSEDHSYVTQALTAHNCLPKDTKALANLSRKLNLDLDLFACIDRENNKFKTTVFEGMRP